MRIPSWQIAAIALLVWTTSGGCGSVPKKGETLIDELRGYNEGIRWRQYDGAAMRIPAAEREDFLDEHEELEEELRVSDFEFLRIRYRDQRRRARVDVRFTWYLDSVGLVRKTVTRQEWERRGKRWYMIDEVRLRGEPMPGVAEPSEEEPEEEIEADDGAPRTSPQASIAE